MKRALLALLGVLIAVPTAQGQAPADAPTTTESRPIASATLLLGVGSQDDPEGLGGLAWMTAQTLAEEANATLAGRALVEASVDRSTTAFTLTARPSEWPSAWSTLEDIVFDGAADPAHFDGVRARLRNQLVFMTNSPVGDFDRAAAQALAAAGHPWARAHVGRHESVSAATTRDLEALRAAHYVRSAATTAFVGSDATNSASVAPRSSQETAWTVGGRTDLFQEVTSAWISVAYPVAPGTSRTTAEFVVDILHDAVDPLPPDPQRYSVDVSIVDTPTGPVVVAKAAVFPEAADRWENRLVNAVATLRDTPPTGEFFQWARRRFRSHRLLADAHPSDRSLRMAHDLHRDGVVRDLSDEIWRLDEATIAAAIRGLGEPRIVRLGPDLGALRR